MWGTFSRRDRGARRPAPCSAGAAVARRDASTGSRALLLPRAAAATGGTWSERQVTRSVSWPIVELFAGIGSVARAFRETAAFDPILLTDRDTAARDNLVHNDPGLRY